MLSMLLHKMNNNGGNQDPHRREELRSALRNSHELLSSSLTDAKYIVFDTELTGLKTKRDSIVSIGALKMVGSRIYLGDYYYRLMEPRTELTGKSIVIHNITPSEVSDSPDIDTLLPEFLDFCKNSVLVGHFVSVDLAFLNKEVKRLYGATLTHPAVDTQKIYRWLLQQKENACAFHEPALENIDLATLAKKFNIPVSQSHNALDDAYVTAQLFQRFLPMLAENGIRTVAELLRIGKP